MQRDEEHDYVSSKEDEQLYYAVLKGDVKEVQRILDLRDVNVNNINKGETLLYAASRTGKLPVIKLLLDYGADKNTKDEGKTLFKLIEENESIRNKEEILELLRD